jgi:hypothetical protein
MDCHILSYNDRMAEDSTPVEIGRSREFVETALRVLVSWNQGHNPMSLDVERLQIAFPDWAHLHVDELACHVIHNFSRIAFPPAIADPDGYQDIQKEVA